MYSLRVRVRHGLCEAGCGTRLAGTEIAVFIGPEGGFEETEIEKAREAGVVPVSLGKRILRTETAGLALLSVLAFHLEGGL